MRFFCLLFSVFIFSRVAAQHPLKDFGTVWSDPKFTAYNTAARVPWMTAEERDVVYVLNLVRSQPQLFLQQVVKKWPQHSSSSGLEQNSYYRSLCTDLEKQKPVGLLYADSLLWVSAFCHASTAGKKGYVGHDRQTKACEQKESFMGECCNYGYSKAIDIVMSLLIDDNVPSLGHRKILLMPYTKVGVSIQPHTEYGMNTVLDFK